jgi:hypothetical protein
LVMSGKDTLRGKSSSLCEANPQAARNLGVNVEAEGKRVKRGSLRSDKDPDSRVFVCLDAGVTRPILYRRSRLPPWSKSCATGCVP